MISFADSSTTKWGESAGSGAVTPSPQQSFLEHVKSVLNAPLPECLRSIAAPSNAASLGSSGLPPAGEDVMLRLLLPTGYRPPSVRRLERLGRSRHSDTAADATTGLSGPAPARPFYERLLEEGRAMAERHERQVMRSIAAETADMRPAPTLPPHYRHGALPADGARIEDKLLRRAREREEALEQRRLQAQAERERGLRAEATFRPAISAKAHGTEPRFRRPRRDFEQWRAQRKQEIEAARKAEGVSDEAAILDRPVINPVSARLAAERRRRQSCERTPVPAAASAALSTPRPRSRDTSVAERLYADAAAQDRRRIESAQQENSELFCPTISPRAAAAAPRYRLSTMYGAPRRDSPRGRSRSATRAERPPFTPSIDLVSAAIASQLPQSSRQRLLHRSRTSGASSAASEVPCTPRGEGPPSARRGKQAPLPPHIVDALEYYEWRRQERLEALRAEEAERERRACTFAPIINETRPATDGGAAMGWRREEDSILDDRSVAQRSEQWRAARDRRVAALRELQRLEEEAADARERAPYHAGLLSARGGRSRPASAAGQPPGAEEHVQRQSAARSHREQQNQSTELRFSPRPCSAAASSPSRRLSSAAPTMGGIYQKIYRVDPRAHQ